MQRRTPSWAMHSVTISHCHPKSSPMINWNTFTLHH
uniref:Uncharacterized protein n=1 Tax=Arundo donax TaxID=35708 RepID=A0A0A9AF50_ARUDO